QILTGGGGSDVFQFNGGGHTDTITDWNANDTIQFQASQSNALQALVGKATVTLTDINGGTRVSIGGNSITLTGVQATSLTASNFLLPPGVALNLVIDRNSPQGGFMAGGGFGSHSAGHGPGGFT
ncbi:MAG TPA: hypothetical protein VHX39_16810, partial [Acetobacteraceae bacterium]|nr:hypothetical protein [Acetobacteraceae bacterium]